MSKYATRTPWSTAVDTELLKKLRHINFTNKLKKKKENER